MREDRRESAAASGLTPRSAATGGAHAGDSSHIPTRADGAALLHRASRFARAYRNEQAFRVPSVATRITSAVSPSSFMRAGGRPIIATPHSRSPSNAAIDTIAPCGASKCRCQSATIRLAFLMEIQRCRTYFSCGAVEDDAEAASRNRVRMSVTAFSRIAARVG